jgi:hypothetical protein
VEARLRPNGRLFSRSIGIWVSKPKIAMETCTIHGGSFTPKTDKQPRRVLMEIIIF